MQKPENRESLSSRSIAQRAIDFPEQISLASETEKITAFEFNEIVNSFSQTLSQIPKSPTFLPVLLGPNINSVIAYHAAIRSRTPFALIDSNVNPDYLQSILTRLGNPKYFVNTNPEALNISALEQVFVGRDKAKSFTVPNSDVNESASILFTSGSTGEPKGIVWDWSIFDAMFESNREYFSDRIPSHKMGRFSSLAFTGGAWQAMSAALGPQLYVLNPGNSADEIINFVNKEEISDLAFSTSFGERIFDTKSNSLKLNCVSELAIYGESVNWVQIGKLRELTDNKSRITNFYGASEAPGTFVQYRIKATDPLGVGRVPLALINEYPNLELLPVGEDGDLRELVMKCGVAQGYFENEELTAQKFFTGTDGVRRYQSGDLARTNTEGLVSYIGRRDDLVKINGRLVEPAEAEAVLRVMVGIKLLTVIPHTNTDGKSTLVAHLVLDEGSALSPTEIYTRLLDKLSSHLVPTKLVKHKEIPLTANGKIDRQYLLNNDWPRWKDNELDKELNMYEKFALTQLQQVLNKPDLTLHEDIFGAGMDSLAAIEFEVAARAYGYTKINPSIFLRFRTAEAVAIFLATEGAAKESNIVELNKNGLKPPIFIFPGAGVTAIFYKEFADAVGQDQPLTIIEPKGLHTMQDIEVTVAAMANSAAEHINSAFPEGQIQLIGHSAGSMIACVSGMNLSDLGRSVKMISLDAIGFANQIAMSGKRYSFISNYDRFRVLTQRSPEVLRNSIIRRLKARNQSSYEFFLLHVGGLALRHKLVTKPDFEIRVLYCRANQRFRDWEANKLLSYEQVEGTHETLLNRQYLPTIVPKIVKFFEG